MDTARSGALPGAAAAFVLAGSACATAWFDHGSIAAGDWLPYAILVALFAATLILARAAARPQAAVLVGLCGLVALAAWQFASLAWSPLPPLARDEALLTLLFAIGVAVPALAARTGEARVAALWMLAVAFGGFALLTGLALLVGGGPLTRFTGGRLYFPITYSNAQAALFLAGFWPGTLLAARRSAPLGLRAIALGAAAATAAGAFLAQSKGSLLGLAAAFVVVAVVSPARLRVLLAAGLALAAPAALAGRLTEPFRAAGDPGAIRRAGAAVLVAAVAGAAIGLLYAVLDRRIDLTSRRRRVGQLTGLAGAAALLAGVVLFLAAVGSPSHWAQGRWDSFKSYRGETGATHFTNLGSNRYDFWRRSIDLYEAHPIAGCGARCFGPEYLLDRRSPERPKRSHSLLLDTAAEGGTIGLLLLFAGLVPLLYAVVRGARRRRAPAVAALAGTTGFLAQASVDWTWTFPAVGLAYALLLGLGVAGGSSGVVGRRTGRIAGLALVAVALLVFAPPWLAARLTTHALAGSPHGDLELRWAARLDPLSPDPLIARAVLSPTLGAELEHLRAAVAREPRAVEPRYFLGAALLNAGHRAEARDELERALRLDPGNASIVLALRKAR